jgi:excisionase family DNA binding protein
VEVSGFREEIREALAEELDARGVRPMGTLPQLITFAEAAKRLGISERYLRELVAEGAFPPPVQHKEGGRLMVDARDVEAYVLKLKSRNAAA